MPNRSTDALYQLIHSLQKSEKRNFKLYAQRNSGNNDLKIVQLFNAIDRQQIYDEDALIRKNPELKKQQLPNLKAHLYKQILNSIRLLRSNTNARLQLYEQLEYAKILYDKGLYHQSLRFIEKIKETAKQMQELPILIHILEEEKKIEALHITRSLQDKADELTKEVNDANERFVRRSLLSNLALQLYGWYIKNGLARNERDEKEINEFFKKHMFGALCKPEGFFERMYYYQCYCWYAFIRQDFLMYYRYSKKWVEEFDKQPEMLATETGNFIKGIHNLLNAHFTLRDFEGFKKSLKKLESFAESDVVTENDNNRIQAFVYLYIAKINGHFLEGTFKEGLKLVDYVNAKLEEYELFLDKHRTLIFYYKIASLYFGAGYYGRSIDFLNKIINWKVNLRSDLQCYARLLHLIAHYELGNFQLLEYLVKSVYRFMAKMENLSRVEEEMFGFLKRSFHLSPKELKPEFKKLLDKISAFQSSKFETRAFVYLDIVSWLESKVSERPIAEIIRKKYLDKKRF